ncbi:MAG: S8 family serine peptidase [Candidatus Binatia bacterium]
MKRRRQRAKTRFKPLADMPIRDRKSEAFRCLDARLARVALVSESAREIPPSGRRVAGTRGRGAASAGRRDLLAPAMQRPGQALEGLIAVPATLRDLPLTRLGLLALVSESSVRRLATCDRVSVLVEAEPSRADAVGHLLARPGIERVRAVSPGLFIARVPRGRLEGLAANAAVRFVEASVRLRSHCELAHVRSDLVAADGKRRVAETGKGVLIGIVDSGIDASHPAFWNARTPRIVHYRDQVTGDLYDQAAIAAGHAKRSPDTYGHGTHVAGIAAGNGAKTPNARGAGVAPGADLAIVKSSLSTADIADGVAEIFELAAQRKQPCVINLSLGGHAGGHDGSSILERAIDTLCEERGRAVVVSAGNEGMARIHASTVLDCGSPKPAHWTADIELKAQIIENTLVGFAWIEVWTANEDNLRVTLRSPNGELFTPPRKARDEQGRDQFAVEMTHQVAHYSGDQVTSFGIHTVPQAPWLSGWSIMVEEDRSAGKNGVEVGAVHAWIQDEQMGGFTNGFARSHLVGPPGTAAAAITVAAYATRREWPSREPQSATTTFPAIKLDEIAYFSSPGPTRTGHNKPDVAAPGQWIVSTLSSKASAETIPDNLRLPNAPYAALAGTSMAAPYVTGAVALLFERHPTMHWAEIKRRLVASTRKDHFSRPCWNDRWGNGKLSIERFLAIEP